MLIISLRQKLYQLEISLNDLQKENDQLKKNVKVTKHSELETDKKEFYEETIRLRNYALSLQNTISQQD